MRSGIAFEQGEIVLVQFPFTNLTLSKKRPVLILSTAIHNKRSLDFVCCGITSNIKSVTHSVLIQTKDLTEGFLPKPSRVKVDTIFTLEKSIVIRRLGKIRPNVLERVRKELFDLF